MKTKGKSKTLRKLKRGTRKHGATILTILAGIGVVATAFFAADAAPKAKEAIDEAEEEMRQDAIVNATDAEEVDLDKIHLSRMGRIKIASRFYIKAITLGLLTIACLVGARVVAARDLAAATATVVSLSQMVKEGETYKKITKEVVGEDKEKEIRNAVNQAIAEEREKTAKMVKESGVVSTGAGYLDIIKTGYGEDRFYDKHFGIKLYTSEAALKKTCERLSKDLKNETSDNLYGTDIVTYDQIFKDQNVPDDRITRAMEKIGWERENGHYDQIIPNFDGEIILDGLKYTVIDFEFGPKGFSFEF